MLNKQAGKLLENKVTQHVRHTLISKCIMNLIS